MGATTMSRPSLAVKMSGEFGGRGAMRVCVQGGKQRDQKATRSRATMRSGQPTARAQERMMVATSCRRASGNGRSWRHGQTRCLLTRRRRDQVWAALSRKRNVASELDDRAHHHPTSVFKAFLGCGV